MKITPAEVRKFIVAVVGFAAEAVNAGIVPAGVARWVAIGIAAFTAAGVYVVPNGKAAVAMPAPKLP